MGKEEANILITYDNMSDAHVDLHKSRERKGTRLRRSLRRQLLLRNSKKQSLREW